MAPRRYSRVTLPPLIVVLGPTSSGKSTLAVELARCFDGEVVSADSRQVYTGLDIGTGKISQREMRGVPHHMLDVASPRRQYSVAQYQRQATRVIASVHRRGKLPILCGGTGWYIAAVVDDVVLPEVAPNPQLRQTLETLTTNQLVQRLRTLDAHRARLIDRHNRRRLTRAIEIASALGSVPRVRQRQRYNTLLIGLRMDDTTLRRRIRSRLRQRIRQGLFAEAQRVHERGISYVRMEALGLEYRVLANWLRGRTSKQDAIRNMEQANWQYARRQKTWFRRDKRIRWVPSLREAQNAVRVFLRAKE